MLVGTAARKFDWVAFGVTREFSLDGLRKIDPAHGGELEEQDRDIRRFFFDSGTRARIVKRHERAIVRHPAKVIHQLACLDGNRHREVLRIVKLLPVTLRSERDDHALKTRDVGFGGWLRGRRAFIGLHARMVRDRRTQAEPEPIVPIVTPKHVRGIHQRPISRATIVEPRVVTRYTAVHVEQDLRF